MKDITKTAADTGKYIDTFLKYELLTLDSVPCYEYDEMLNIIYKAYDGSLTKESAKILMKRGVEPAFKKGKYFFTRDPKLKVKYLLYIIYLLSSKRVIIGLQPLYEILRLLVLYIKMYIHIYYNITFRFQYWECYPWI